MFRDNIERYLGMQGEDGDQRHVADTIDKLISQLEQSFKNCSSNHQAYIMNIKTKDEREKERSGSTVLSKGFNICIVKENYMSVMKVIRLNLSLPIK